MDNFLGTTQDENQLQDVYQSANFELMKPNMPLRMWVSNKPTLNKIVEKVFPDYKVPNSTQILGLHWDVKNDTISIQPPVFVDYSSLSKRKLLSLVSSV